MVSESIAKGMLCTVADSSNFAQKVFMQSGKLIQLLATLSKKEFKDFVSFVDSEFFNKNKNLSRFLALLSNFQGDWESPKLDKDAFIKKHYADEDLDDQKFRYLQSDLTKLLEQFLSYREFEQDSFRQRYYLVRSYNKRNLDKYFQQELELLRSQTEKPVYRDSEFYYNLHTISELSYEFTSEKRNRSFDTSLQAVIDNLEIAYLARGFRYYCEMINRRNILSVEYNLSFFDDLVKYLSNGTFDDIPAIYIYRLIHITLTEPDNQENYQKLLEALASHGHLFSNREIRGMYVFAQNFCIKRINRGQTEALQDIFGLYKQMVEKNLLYEGSYVSQPDFKNIVTTALRLGETEWVAHFIEDYRTKLNPEFAENAYTYSMAWLHFSRAEYDKALKMLLRVEFNDVYYHLDSKSLLMKVYYEMEEYDGFFSLVEAFKIYLRRNKFISDFQRDTYHNFILLVNKLMKIKLGKNAMTWALADEIDQTKPVADLTWLRQKAEERIRKERLKARDTA